MAQEYHFGFAAFVGRSNVGKSTLMNALVGEKVAIVSERPQTTRNIIRGVLNAPDGQVVFVDTPGLHVPRNRLSEYMVHAAHSAISGVDVLLAVFDVSAPMGAGDRAMMDLLAQEELPVIALLNKIDKIHDKTELLQRMQELQSYKCIQEIVPVSALRREGLDELLRTIIRFLPQGEAMFSQELYTDQSERFLVSEFIREKALRELREEIPHGIGVEILQMEEDEDERLVISANILCEKATHKGMIIGKQGSRLKRIGTQARRDIAHMMGIPVYLQLWVKVKPNWRDNLAVMRDLGYDQRHLDS